MSVGFYVESASGDECQVVDESVALVLVSSKSFNETCCEDEKDVQNELKCPISLGIMPKPAKCSDGRTYDRAWTETWAKINPIAPETRIPLTFKELPHVGKLW